LAVEGNSLPVTLSESIFLVRLEWLGFGRAGCIIIDLDILYRTCAVTAAVGQDIDCKAALNAERGDGDKDLEEMHFSRCQKYQESFS
jgi:hypothetical protein